MKRMLLLTLIYNMMVLCSGCSTPPRVHQELSIEGSVDDAAALVADGGMGKSSKVPIRVCCKINIDY